jgi:hypothetical protein
MYAQRTTRIVLVILLVIGIFIAAVGYIDTPIRELGMGKIAESNEKYLKNSLDKAVTGFLILSGIKTGLAVIEGSEIGVGFNLELGDIVQSVYDYVDIAWKTALAGGTVILLTRLVIKAVALIDHWCFALALFAILISLTIKWFFPGYPRILRITREATFFTIMFTVVFYLIFPFSISGAALLSEKITAPLIQESQQSFESIKDEFSFNALNRRLFPEELNRSQGWFSYFDFYSKLEKAKELIREQTQYYKDKTRNIAIWTLQIIAGYLFDSIVFPVTFFILLFVITKGALIYLFEERKHQSLKEDIAAVIEKFYTVDDSKSEKGPARRLTLRRLRRYRRLQSRSTVKL